MSDEDDGRLVQQAKEGNAAAFAEIYTRHHDAIYTYVYYRVNDASLAEDLAGEMFVRMVERIDAFTYRGRPILAWLYTIARNLIVDHQRKQSKADHLPLDQGLVAGGASPLEKASQNLDRDCLQKSMKHLAQEQQRVILHRLIEGRSNAQVAILLDKTEGAIKSLQHRALAALRRAVLKERCYEPSV
jgi:RNA polymerase sigma-70 factor (ECF subfamily)